MIWLYTYKFELDSFFKLCTCREITNTVNLMIFLQNMVLNKQKNHLDSLFDGHL